MPLVSVVIPTYNRAYCLPIAVDSALGQTHRDVEVIVLDDGSTDETPALMASRYGSDSRVRYQRQENRGVSAARNAAFALLRGDYVALLDSDDVFLPWKLELQLACFQHSPQIGMVWTDLQATARDGTTVIPRYLKRMYTAWRWFREAEIFDSSVPLAELVPHLSEQVGTARLWTGDVFSPMVMGSLVHTSTVLLRRERFDKVRFFREDLRLAGEDYDFHLRTCREGPVGFADLDSIVYRTGAADQLTQQEYMVHIAHNFLKTVEPMLETERARIRLPKRMLNSVISEAHRWYAEELVLAGNSAAARAHFWHALRFDPRVRTAVLLGMTFLPDPVRAGIRWARRRVLPRRGDS